MIGINIDGRNPSAGVALRLCGVLRVTGIGERRVRPRDLLSRCIATALLQQVTTIFGSHHDLIGLVALNYTTPFRYHMAEGVKLYCQETWRTTFGSERKAMVERYISIQHFNIMICIIN